MAYRERKDPREIALELLREAYAAEANAAADKARAHAEVASRQAKLEVAWAEHGVATELERHVSALVASAPTERSERSDEEMAALARVTQSLAERGVDPPKIGRTRESKSDLAPRLEQAGAQVARAKTAIHDAARALADARVALEKALDALQSATNARIAALAEAERSQGVP